MLLDAPLPTQSPRVEDTAPSVRLLSFSAGIFLTLELLIATSADFLWYGPLPAWCILPIIGAIFAVLDRNGRQALAEFLGKIMLPVVLPWILFTLVISGIDISKGLIEESGSRRVFLNLAGLFSLIMTGFWATRVRPRMTVYVLLFVAAMQATVSIAQYSGNTLAWSAPELILKFSGARTDKVVIDDSAYLSVGRVRGTNPYVHKFTPMQGITCAFLISVLVLNFQSKNPLSTRTIPLLLGTLLGTVGMFLTFSRSSIYGTALLLGALLLSVRRFGTVALMVTIVGLAYGVGTQLNLEDSKQFNRISDVDTTRGTNAGRINQYSRALNDFRAYPLIGHPQGSSSRYAVPIHSVILRIMVDYGVFGAVLYLAVLAGILRTLWRYRKRQGDETRVIALAAIGAIFVALLDSWTHSSGLLVVDVTQPPLFGAFLGAVIGDLGQRIADRPRFGSNL